MNTNRVYYLITKMLQRLGIQTTDQTQQTVVQAIGFAAVGLTNTAVSYAIYAATLLLIRSIDSVFEWGYIIAQFASFVLSVLWSYWWNSRLVFKSHGKLSLVKTYISYSITGLILSSALLYFWIHVIKTSEFIAPIINLLITVPLNFVLNKYWAFNNK